jgi:hypothetical protein
MRREPWYSDTTAQAFRDAIKYQREHREGGDWPGQIGLYKSVARELGIDLGNVAAPSGPVLDPDGRQLAAADVTMILGALSHAIDLMDERTDAWCEACIQAPGGACDVHADDIASAEAYRALAERLGDDR